MSNLLVKTLLFSLFFFWYPSVSKGEIIKTDTVWKGEINLEDDILVPEGVTLTIMPGTVINVLPSDRTRTDPEYLSSMTEITVRGRLEVEGDKGARVLFHIKDDDKPSLWSGIIIDGGSVLLRSVDIRNAETGILALKGAAVLSNTVISNNRYGLVAYRDSALQINDTGISGNSYGVFELSGPEISYSNVSVRNNLKRDIYQYGSYMKEGALEALDETTGNSLYAGGDLTCLQDKKYMMADYNLTQNDTTRKYNDEVLLADTVWRGRIEIDGLVRVPYGVRLVVMPGTIVEFKKKDTNGDGIGENGLLMQGVFIAKGTRDRPIIFRSAERIRQAGDWDAINIMGSDGARNLIEFSQVEDAYRGLHFHFSNVIVSSSVLKNNYRAIQFQEASVEARDNIIYNNKSGIKARDSKIEFLRNSVFSNINGVSFFRTNLKAYENRITGNLVEGMKIREGSNAVYDNLIDCNRSGIMVSDTYFGRFTGNVVSNNFETGISLRDSDNIELGGSYVQGNGFNGINVLSVGAVISGNQIIDNGERGIGIQAFTGLITGNSIAGNRMYAIENESGSGIEAPMNWWGEGPVEEAVFDRADNEERGKVNISPVNKEPFTYEWPLETINSKIMWRDRILLNESITVTEGGELKIAPGTEIKISKGKGINVSSGKIIAKGTKEKNIYFSSTKKEVEDRWNEILLEYADGSVFSYCNISGAEWGIHSHFTPLNIENCAIMNNYGGIRFRSGPLEISNSNITGNSIGIRAFRGIAAITENGIINNEIGIFIREKGGGLTIRNNNFSSNSDYNIRVGDFNIEDVDARENWWGTERPEDSIFDGRREPGVGKVLFEPVLTSPLELSR